MTTYYDAWQQVTTKNGFTADEIISGLQKSIRRSDEENALAMAYEMYITSEQLEDYMWKRLLVISVEDIGFADTNATLIIRNLEQTRKDFQYGSFDRGLFMIQAVRYLCKCNKDRSSDLMLNILREEFAKGRTPVIEDHMLDMHTRQGRINGKDLNHFLHVASHVEPLAKDTQHQEFFTRLQAILNNQ